MLSYQVEESIDVNISPSQAIEFLSDFRNWPSWSPWLIQEPSCPLTYTENQGNIGSGYSWDGEMIGAGSMSLTEKSESVLVMALSFLKPFKSQAKVTFTAKPKEDGCVINWTMESKVPWFLFFLKGMFKTWIRMDYHRGLIMLKSQLETGHVHSKVTVLGEQPWPDTYYIAYSGTAPLEELGPTMQNHFNRLNAYMEEHQIQPTGVPFAIYDTMDFKTTVSDFHSCIPVSNHDLPHLPDDMELGHLEGGTSFVTGHEGEYPFLGNAWSTAMSASRFHKVKTKKKPLGIERYENDSRETPAQALLTDIVLLCRP